MYSWGCLANPSQNNPQIHAIFLEKFNTVKFKQKTLFNVLTMREMTIAGQAIGLGARRIFLRICKVPALKEAGLAAALSKAAVFRHAKMAPNHRHEVQPKSFFHYKEVKNKQV